MYKAEETGSKTNSTVSQNHFTKQASFPICYKGGVAKILLMLEDE